MIMNMPVEKEIINYPIGLVEYDKEIKSTTTGHIAYSSKLVVYESKLHLLGSSNSSDSRKHSTYDSINGWVEVSTIPYEFRQGSACVYDGDIHILGGGNDTSNYYYHYKWNKTDGWVKLANLPHMVADASAVVYKGELHILGGYNSTSYTGINKHYKWDKDTDTWTSVSTIPYIFRQGSACVYKGNIHILGGESGYNDSSGTSTTNCHYRWNEVDGWVKDVDVTVTARGGSCTVYNDKIYLLPSNNSENFVTFDGSKWEGVAIVGMAYGTAATVINYNDALHKVGGNNKDAGNLYYYNHKIIRDGKRIRGYAEKDSIIYAPSASGAISDNLEPIEGGYIVTETGEVKIGIYE